MKLRHTWGLGGMAVLLISMQFVTGILLRFAYEPFPGKAHDSIVYLQNEILFGQLVRNLHHWSGIFLIVIVFFHLLRVFFQGAFHPPRQFNWLIGLTLLFCVVLSNFTGYLLPWDQLAYWAITVSTSMLQYVPIAGNWLQTVMRGGAEVGPATLLNFYTMHTGIIPLLIIVLMTLHFWRVRKAGGVVIPGGNDTSPAHFVPTIPDLVFREMVVALVLIGFISLFSALFDAPLQAKANPGLSPNPAKAPWYFLGIQELLLHVHPFFAVFVVPVLTVGALIYIPYLKYDSDKSGAWFHSARGRRTGLIAGITAIALCPVAILTDEYLLDFNRWLPAWPTLVTNGLFPLAITLVGIAGFYAFIKRKYSASNNETVQALFIFLLTSFLILTATGFWFRGAGMALTWPWNVP